MTKTLEGKVAVITGAARNIGKHVAAEMINRGAKVVIGDILDAEGEATIKEFNEKYGTKFYFIYIICRQKNAKMAFPYVLNLHTVFSHPRNAQSYSLYNDDFGFIGPVLKLLLIFTLMLLNMKIIRRFLLWLTRNLVVLM